MSRMAVSDPSLPIRGAIILLSAFGLWNALYFTFAYYGRVKGARWVPAILCAREGSSCVTVVQTSYARVFGVPNSLLGIIYYAALILWAAAPGLAPAWFVSLLIAASAVTVILGFYLIYSLLAKLHTHCPLCYTAHAINAALLVLLVLAARKW
jgi:uncharacterized membrane protein